MLCLYECVFNESTCQLLVRQNVQSIGSLILGSSTSVKVKLLCKALVARLIPTDVSKDEMAVLMLTDDAEVDLLINMLSPDQFFPSLSVMTDLCRSPHNMYALVSRDATSKLSEMMESLSEDNQSKAAQLIWEIMQLTYEGDEVVSAVINNGSLKCLCDQGT